MPTPPQAAVHTHTHTHIDIYIQGHTQRLIWTYTHAGTNRAIQALGTQGSRRVADHWGLRQLCRTCSRRWCVCERVCGCEYVCVRACVRVCVCSCVWVCWFVCVREADHAWFRLCRTCSWPWCACVWICVCMCVCMCVCVCVCVYMRQTIAYYGTCAAPSCKASGACARIRVCGCCRLQRITPRVPHLLVRPVCLCVGVRVEWKW